MKKIKRNFDKNNFWGNDDKMNTWTIWCHKKGPNEESPNEISPTAEKSKKSSLH